MTIDTSTLTSSEVQRVLMFLGYEYPYTDYDHLDRFKGSPLPIVSGPLPTEVLSRVRAILIRLTELDTLQSTAVGRSHAIAVDNLKLNYVQQILLLRNEGSILLRELAHHFGLEVVRDKYHPKPSAQSYYY